MLHSCSYIYFVAYHQLRVPRFIGWSTARLSTMDVNVIASFWILAMHCVTCGLPKGSPLVSVAVC
jgi:hypothetical protein